VTRKLWVAASLFLAAAVAYGVWSIWPGVDIKVVETKMSPDGKWTAVVQREVYESFSSVNDVVYAVRLKGPAQKDRRGDLIINVQVNTPDPPPSIEWSNGILMVTLLKGQKVQYFATSVEGVAVTVQER
jgi:hypothetical protein